MIIYMYINAQTQSHIYMYKGIYIPVNLEEN